MPDKLTIIQDTPVLVCESNGQKLSREQDALDLIGEAMQSGAEVVAISTERFDRSFFQLKTGLLGQVIQKFVTYRKHLVVFGDISPYLADSKAFKDFVYEANRGKQIWFIANLSELAGRLAGDR